MTRLLDNICNIALSLGIVCFTAYKWPWLPLLVHLTSPPADITYDHKAELSWCTSQFDAAHVYHKDQIYQRQTKRAWNLHDIDSFANHHPLLRSMLTPSLFSDYKRVFRLKVAMATHLYLIGGEHYGMPGILHRNDTEHYDWVDNTLRYATNDQSSCDNLQAILLPQISSILLDVVSLDDYLQEDADFHFENSRNARVGLLTAFKEDVSFRAQRLASWQDDLKEMEVALQQPDLCTSGAIDRLKEAWRQGKSAPRPARPCSDTGNIPLWLVNAKDWLPYNMEEEDYLFDPLWVLVEVESAAYEGGFDPMKGRKFFPR